MKVGFIGIGNMGGPMCRNIIKGGHDVTVFDLNPAAVKTCTDLGAKAAASPKELASLVDVVMTSLPMPKDVEAVALGPDGIIEGIRQGSVYIDLSTNSPTMIRKIAGVLAPKGVVTLDAPVSGGAIGAEKKTIAIMVGGDKAAYDRCMPVFESFGQNISHLGALGSGAIAKIVNNMLAFSNMAAAAEGLMLGAAAGIDPEALNEVIRNSSGNSMAYRGVAHKTLNGDWSPTFTIDLAYKDLHLALELGDELGVPLALGAQTHNLMRMARGMGFGGDDATALMRVYETTLGREVRKKK
ncbi:MAG: NAD(P)-dependent oxidoreductase [Alphaproteobacteria bacterium]|nr:NAD(P)-dependent oxidoreductase [Alphaproteobacteria bacterium]